MSSRFRPHPQRTSQLPPRPPHAQRRARQHSKGPLPSHCWLKLSTPASSMLTQSHWHGMLESTRVLPGRGRSTCTRSRGGGGRWRRALLRAPLSGRLCCARPCCVYPWSLAFHRFARGLVMSLARTLREYLPLTHSLLLCARCCRQTRRLSPPHTVAPHRSSRCSRPVTIKRIHFFCR